MLGKGVRKIQGFTLVEEREKMKHGQVPFKERKRNLFLPMSQFERISPTLGEDADEVK